MQNINTLKRDKDYRSLSTSRTGDLFPKTDLNLINTQEIHHCKKDNIISLTPMKRTFMKKINKNNFVLAYVPKSKLNFPKTSNLIMRQTTRMTHNIDLSTTLFSLGGGGLVDTDYMKFKTEYYLKYAKNIDLFKSNGLIISALSSASKTKCQSIYPKILKLHDDNVNLLFKKIRPDVILEMSLLKEIVSLSYELFLLMNQHLNEIIQELMNEQNKNEKAQQKIYDIEKYYLNEIAKANQKKFKHDFHSTSQTSVFENETKMLKMLDLQREDSKKMLNIHRLEEE